jgi:hypothetical protein
MANKNYYVIVNEKTGKMLTHSATLPVYWRKDVADYMVKTFPGHKVVPISIKSFYNFLNGINT